MAQDSHPLARSVLLLARRLRQERHTDLTPNQVSVLSTLIIEGPLTPGEIAQRERVKPPSITRIVSCLEDEGLVNRSPDPDDKRQVVIEISQQGEDMLSAERARRDHWLAERLADLSDHERDTLRQAAELLTRLARS